MKTTEYVVNLDEDETLEHHRMEMEVLYESHNHTFSNRYQHFQPNLMSSHLSLQSVDPYSISEILFKMQKIITPIVEC